MDIVAEVGIVEGVVVGVGTAEVVVVVEGVVVGVVVVVVAASISGKFFDTFSAVLFQKLFYYVFDTKK